MKLVSLDQSINGTGLTICEADENYNIIHKSIKSFYMTETKKKVEFNYNNTINGILNIKTNKFENRYLKNEFVINKIMELLPNPNECFIIMEANALQGKGKILDIAEFTGALKYELVKSGYKFEQFEPTAMKSALGKFKKGDNKLTVDIKMRDQHEELYNYVFRDITDDKIFKDGDSPKADVVDTLLFIIYYLKLLKEMK